MKVLVVGGGISGLSATIFLRRAGHDAVCIEASQRPGGLIRTELRDGFLCETGPQGILDGARATRELIEHLSLDAEVIRPAAVARRRFVFVDGKLRELPTGPWSLLRTDLLSARGKLRLFREPWIAPQPTDKAHEDESVYAFAERRFGSEAARNLAAPGTIGLFAGDAAKLSMRSAFPIAAAFESSSGSVWRGMRAARRRGEGPGQMLSFRTGLERLPQAMAERLGPSLVCTRVVRVQRDGQRWRVDANPALPDPLADAVVLAVPAAVAHDLLAPTLPAAVSVIELVENAAVAVVCLGFATSDIGMRLDGYGFLVARGERPTLLGCQFESSIFAGRAPPGGALLRVFVGGTFAPAQVNESELALVERTTTELAACAGLRAKPDFSAVFRHPQAIPQFTIGHSARIAALHLAIKAVPGLYLLGNAFTGVGINGCIAAAAKLPDVLMGQP